MPATTTLSHPHLKQLQEDLDAVGAAFRALQTTSSHEQLIWKPEAKVWNLLEVVDHLNATGDAYYPLMRSALQEAAPGEGIVFKPTWMGKLMLKFLDPASSLKLKTFRVFKPGPALTDATVFDRYFIQQTELTKMIRDAVRVDFNRTNLRSPVTSLMRFSIGDALTMMVVHQQRHLGQARGLTERAGFPA